jgi:hypothetical protein
MLNIIIIMFLLSWILLIILGILTFYCKVSSKKNINKTSYTIVLGLCSLLSLVFPPLAFIPILEYVRA